MAAEKAPKAAEHKKPAVPPASNQNTQEKEYAQASKMYSWIQWAVGSQNRAEMSRQAGERFQALGDYKDSAARAAECLAMAERAETEEREEEFRAAIEEVDSARTADDYCYAAQALRRMTSHPEAAAAEQQCMEKYRRHRWGKTFGKIAAAVLLCLLLAGGAVLTRTGAIQYGVGSAFMTLHRYENAVSWFRHASDFGDSEEKIAECSYQVANSEFEQGAYAKAYKTYREIGGYRGAEDRAAESFRLMLVNTKPGSVVEFGQTEPGKPAKWYVLDNNGETATLIGEFNVTHAYDSRNKQSTWADSELRVWLNTEFLSDTFYKYERERLAQPALPSDGGAYGLEGGAATADQVYILSAEEAEAYADILHAVNGNGKAKDKYAATAYGWWLRTPGAAANGAAVVDQQGNIDYYGHDQASDQTGVRPVIQVSLTP